MKKLDPYHFLDRFYGNLKITIFVPILVNFGQIQVLDGFQCFHCKYSKTKTKQHRDLNLVLKLPQINCPFSETFKIKKKIIVFGVLSYGQFICGHFGTKLRSLCCLVFVLEYFQ